MPKLRDFLSNYKTIIFDMDGVITSEQTYWDCAALTVYEWLNSDKYYGGDNIVSADYEKNLRDIRKEVFSDDKLIALLKSKGVNSNWDLGFVVVAASRILDSKDFLKIYEYCGSLSSNILDVYNDIESILGIDWSRNGKIWSAMRDTFQEWYLGDSLFEKTFKKSPVQTGKKGQMLGEEPIIPKDKLLEIFRLLRNNLVRICAGTGRPSIELLDVLHAFGIYEYFAHDGIIHYDYVVTAENKLSTNLTKPHPYMFKKAHMGAETPDEEVVAANPDTDGVLVVGDAGADLFAAKAMGADFCAVLTGVSGENARPFFEENGATYILKSLEDFLEA